MLRRTKRRPLCLVLLIGSLAYLLSMLLFYASLDQGNQSSAHAYSWMKPLFDPFEIIGSRRCPIKETKAGHISSRDWRSPSKTISSDVCMADNDNSADIEMDAEWERISVSYPQMILTVSGWVDTIQVKSWTIRPLHVVVVPFSHQDPGWKSTYDSYYTSFTRSTLSLIVSQLTKNPSWKFVWSEIVFLERWWNEATASQKAGMKKIIETGQLEILGGGWVMPDEASTHYAAILDQMIEGHLWVADVLGTKINSTWAIDPFGHSSTLAYINMEAGIKNMLIQRTHYAVKRHLARNKHLEFYWRQPWGHAEAVFCHMMPFLLYSIAHSCGPERHVCCQFDFHKGSCFRGHKRTGPVDVTDVNVLELSRLLWNQLRQKAELYKSDVVLMPHGDDFRYSTAREWNDQHDNLEKLMNYINGNKDMQMKIEYGTLSDYFNKIHSSKAGPGHQRYPSLTGDFFPYSDRGDQYWSGHYTSRPFHKRMARILQSKLRATEILFTTAQARKLLNIQNATMIYQNLSSARRTLALIQHHDAITGTSRKLVHKDYAERLLKAIADVQNMQRSLLQISISRRNLETVEPVDVWLDIKELPFKRVIDIKATRYLTVNNPLFHWIHKVVSVHVNSVHVAVLYAGIPVRVQLSPVFDDNYTVKAQVYCLSFEVKLPPAASIVFEIKSLEVLDNANLANVTIYKKPDDSKWFRNFGLFKVQLSSDDEFPIGNCNITAKISVCDGMLKAVYRDGYTYRSDLHFVLYKTGTTYNPLKDKSGAYIFSPDGPATELPEDAILVLKISGELFSQVRTVYKDIIHLITIFNISGPEGAGILVENIIDIGNSRWDNRELAIRLNTDITSPQHQLCTDSNGFQMQKRTVRPKFGVQGNFYPITTSVFLEDESSRLSVLTTEAHGAASLASGMLDIILDRRLLQDDWRGLNEGVVDNQPTESTFVILFERKSSNMDLVRRVNCYLSPLASNLSLTYNNPPNVFGLSTTYKRHIEFPLLSRVSSLPCDYHLVSLRTVGWNSDYSMKEVLMILHRTGTHCLFQLANRNCPKTTVAMALLLPFMDITSVTEMSLTGVREKRNLTLGENIYIPPMEIKTYKIVFR